MASRGFEMLAVEAVLTYEEKRTFLDRMTARNPGWLGAHVADLLDIMNDSDAHIDLVEPLAEEHADEWTRTHSFAAQAACVLAYPEPPRWEDITAITERIPRVKRLDIAECEKALDLPVQSWAQQCHGISIGLVQAGLVEGRVARGMCEGVTSQHSWIVVGPGLPDCYADDAEIIDPTLWSYRDDVDGIWYGTAADGLHTPHGKGPNIFRVGKPAPPNDPADAVALCPKTPLSADAVLFLDILGPLDRAGWIRLADMTVTGWPAAEIIAAMDDTIELRGLVPIDRLGMLTDRNPSGLYLRGEEKAIT